ncbi:MAG: M14 family zinc carboxypeptidase [Lagierella massiliensis]|nr:M14 family zinc carboxypeptidase [Lagierella massiliensis]
MGLGRVYFYGDGKIMKELIDRVINRVPDYKTFFTVDELNEMSYEVAEKHKDIVSTFDFGTSKEGEKIIGLKIGNGSKNALVFGLPHPNEPIGTMTIDHLINQLVEDEEFRNSLDYTWYIIKAWDVDGARKNEGWYKGPYNLYNYARNFYRPAGFLQVDWTFPIEYKKLKFDKPIPETKAMMDLIDEIKPEFIYSLHNAGFGGAYWYISRDIKEVYNSFIEAANKQNIPVNYGEPEAPYCEAFAPAIYKELKISDEYDYLEKYGVENPEEEINIGTCSADYAGVKYGSCTLVTELPYFYDKRIDDQSESEITRKEAIKKSIEYAKKLDDYLLDSLEKSKPYVAKDNVFRLAIEAFTDLEQVHSSTLKMIEEVDIYNKKATVAEKFDNLLVSKFYSMLSLGLIIRMNEEELKKQEEGSKGYKILKEECSKAEIKLKELADYLEEKMDYSVVPIKRLVSVQLESGLALAYELNK